MSRGGEARSFHVDNRVKLGVNDEQRAARAVVGAKGKRLTYRTTNSRAK